MGNVSMDSDTKSQIACVTGATGMIGRLIVKKMLALGFQVRVLTRRYYIDNRVQVFNGSFADDAQLDKFINGADFVFNCAGELNDESRMQEVNVSGTAKITDLVAKYRIKYYCHLSSAGVVGHTSNRLVDEETTCQPQNHYEATKLEGEKIASRAIKNCKTIILRPTCVVDSEHLGELLLPIEGTLKSLLKAFVKGGECAHIVHAEDVANAAIFFLGRPLSGTDRLFFVSIDDDPLNTVSDLWSLYKGLESGKMCGTTGRLPHLPMFVPHTLRLLAGRPGNPGSVRYSSNRLISEGFSYSLGVRKIVEKIFLERNKCTVGTHF